LRVIVTGLPYFSKHIHSKLKKHCRGDQFFLLNTYYSYWDRFLYLVLLPFTDVVYSINGVTHGSKVIDLAIRFKKRIVFHWAGSDVMYARKAFENKIAVREYIEKSTHLACSPWFVDELATMNIPARFIPLNTAIPGQGREFPMPDIFSILTYIPQNEEKFYGLEHIIQLARRFPEIPIRIAGMATYPRLLPDNITLLGWIRNMPEEICRNTVCVRMPEHDGLSFFVIESLVNQRYVIYNQRFDPCIYASDDQSLQEKVFELKLKSERHELVSNLEGMEYVLKNFNETDIVQNIYRVLKG